MIEDLIPSWTKIADKVTTNKHIGKGRKQGAEKINGRGDIIVNR